MANNLAEVIAKAKEVAQKILENEVAEAIIKLEQDHIQKDVYNAYTPKIYPRTGDLKKKENFKIERTLNGISVKNVTVHNGVNGEVKDIVDTVEYGRNYDFTGYAYSYEEPRPFVQNTKDELVASQLHVKVLREEMKKKGFNVR
ncbi:hypothetical protein [Clostridium tagluense]|uniref:Phage protein n=1 Tax=Clostridium tagluense TaxID=360422 RepID=A0A401ULP3_9CLOT|nr:hypothetical protein [Clostridium tagluense]GCD10448.1 hypothetical protein Ctaglu_20710 [Clostridium tagluense]